MTREAVDGLIARHVAEALEAHEAARNPGPLVESGDEHDDNHGDDNGNENGGGYGNENGNGDGTKNGNGNENRGGNGNGNYNMNFRGFMLVARECTFQDFLKFQPLNFMRTEGVVGLTRWFKKMETMFSISNCLPKYQVKYTTCTLLNSALTWNEIQKMEAELWNLTVKGNDLTAYTNRFQELILFSTRMVSAEEDRVERLQDVIRIANHLMDKKLKGYAAKNAENKRRCLAWMSLLDLCEVLPEHSSRFYPCF
ncbi:hypothetical protein Tco_1311659 [Tanacetum coccineum]